MPEILPTADPVHPVPFYEQPGYEERLRTAQTAQDFAPDLPCGTGPRKTPIVHRGKNGRIALDQDSLKVETFAPQPPVRLAHNGGTTTPSACCDTGCTDPPC